MPKPIFMAEAGPTPGSDVALPPGFLYATSNALASLRGARTMLYDIDETLCEYDPEYIQAVKMEAFLRISSRLSASLIAQTVREAEAAVVRPYSPKAVIRRHLGEAGVASYYQAHEAVIDETLQPDSIIFNRGALKLLKYAKQRGIVSGLISNSPNTNGNRIMQALSRQAAINLHDQSLLLANSGIEKPLPNAFDAFLASVDLPVPQPMVYFGDIIEDVLFAENIDATGVLHGVRTVPEGMMGHHLVVSSLMDVYDYLRTADGGSVGRISQAAAGAHAF